MGWEGNLLEHSPAIKIYIYFIYIYISESDVFKREKKASSCKKKKLGTRTNKMSNGSRKTG